MYSSNPNSDVYEDLDIPEGVHPQSVIDALCSEIRRLRRVEMQFDQYLADTLSGNQQMMDRVIISALETAAAVDASRQQAASA